MSQPVSLKNIVGKVMRGLTSTKEVNKRDISETLEKILDKKTLRHIKIADYKNNKLIIDVDSSGWLYKLNLEKKDLVDKLNKSLSHPVIKDLVLRLG